MKQKDFVFNICLLVFLNLLVKPFWILGVDIGVQNRVGSDVYGLYFSILSFTMLFNMILDMGITNYNNRNIAQHSDRLSNQFSNIITLRFALGIIYFLAVFVVAAIIGYSKFHLKLLLWIALNQFLNAFILYVRSNISALMMFKTDSVISILDKLLMILFCGILLWSNISKYQFQIEWFIWCQTVSYLITIAIAITIVLRKSYFVKPTFNWQSALSIIKNSFPFALVTFLMTCYYRLDSVMIERLLPNNVAAFQSGIYATAFRLFDTLAIVPYLFSVILLPLFSKMLKEKQNILPITKTAFLLLSFFSLSAAIILFVYREPVIKLFYNDNIVQSVEVFELIIFGLVPLSFTYLFGTLLTANGNLKYLNIIAAACLIINIIMNLILIPNYGAQGSAVASLITQLSVCSLQFAFSLKILNIPFKTIQFTNIAAFALALFISTYLLCNYSGFNTIISLSISIICAFFLSIVFRLFNIKDLQSFKS